MKNQNMLNRFQKQLWETVQNRNKLQNVLILLSYIILYLHNRQ